MSFFEIYLCIIGSIVLTAALIKKRYFNETEEDKFWKKYFEEIT